MFPVTSSQVGFLPVRARAAAGSFLALILLVLGISAFPAPCRADAPPTPAPKVAATAPPAPPSTWVTLEGRRVLEIRSAVGAQTPAEFAQKATRSLESWAKDPDVDPDRIVVREEPPYTFLGLLGADGRFTPRMAVDDRAGRAFGVSRQALAETYRDRLRGAIRQYRSSHSLSSWLRGTALALLVLGLYLLWVRWQCRFNERVVQAINLLPLRWQSFLRLGGTQLVEDSQLRGALQLVRRLLHWSSLLVASYLLIPLLLGFFPPTQVIAEGLRGQILQVVRATGQRVLGFLPDLLSIAVILAVTVLSIRLSNACFAALGKGRIRLSWFYREWARPTGRIAATLIMIGGLLVAYPYVPGSQSKAFQGAGLFLGVLAALGSSAVATNIISGLMLIYTRAFREGDRVEINGILGVVQDRTMLVTRIQTPRNELVSIPNATVIGASIVNYSFSRREIRKPVALSTTITIGYDVPWRRVHELLLAAVGEVEGITDEIEPFVLQTSLNDFHISYELNVFVRNVTTYRQTLSDLLASIQDQFAAADVEILSPGYHAIRNGNASTVPKP